MAMGKFDLFGRSICWELLLLGNVDHVALVYPQIEPEGAQHRGNGEMAREASFIGHILAGSTKALQDVCTYPQYNLIYTTYSE